MKRAADSRPRRRAPIVSSRGRRDVWRRGVLLRLLNALESRRRRRYRGSQASGQLAPERRATGSQRCCRAVGTGGGGQEGYEQQLTLNISEFTNPYILLP